MMGSVYYSDEVCLLASRCPLSVLLSDQTSADVHVGMSKSNLGLRHISTLSSGFGAPGERVPIVRGELLRPSSNLEGKRPGHNTHCHPCELAHGGADTPTDGVC